MIRYLLEMFFCGFVFAFALMMLLWVFIYFDDERNLEDYSDDDQMSLWDDERNE